MLAQGDEAEAEIKLALRTKSFLARDLEHGYFQSQLSLDFQASLFGPM